MPEIIETTVYQIGELSDEAREKAREWYRQGGFDYDWWEFVYDDFERICTMLVVELHTRPVRLYDGDGNPIVNREAVRRRDAMIEKLASLPPVPGALDQIVQHFGAESVAEVTGRSRRIIPKTNGDGSVRFAVQNRPGSANIGETHAFMDDAKQILIFSEAGGTGRSYHADLGAKNQRRRIHYLLEAGWKADAAIQGFGRTNRTNQKQPPMFRPVSTDVKAQKRFISTIARRLDSMGAITRGQRQTGGQNMFRPEDNLESHYARDSLRQLYVLVADGIIESCPTRIFLPNERALEPQIARIYERFGLNDRQIEILSRATPKRDYYCQSRRGNRLFDLGLGDIALAFTAASSKTDQTRIGELFAAHGRGGFAAAWLSHRKLEWAAELLPPTVAPNQEYPR